MTSEMEKQEPICEHLRVLERELLDRRIPETLRGQPWSDNCRQWVYFACVLDLPALRGRLALDACVADHQQLGTHDGSESGFVCTVHHDAIMGLHPADPNGKPLVR